MHVSKFIVVLTNVLLVVADLDLASLQNFQVVFRHGRRSPSSYAWHDQYDEYFNTQGLEQLTPPGRRDLYQLGWFLRSQYRTFLGNNPHMVQFRSTPLDRTIESAQCLAAGLLPPEGPYVWNPDLNWQPKAVYTMFTGWRNFTFLDRFLGILVNDVSPQIQTELQALLSELSETTGNDVGSFSDLYAYYDQADCEVAHGFDLPEWLIPYMGRIRNIGQEVMAGYCNRLNMLGAYTDELFTSITDYFDQNTTSKARFYAVSDAQVSALLCLLISESGYQVPYGAAIIVQLHNLNNQKYVRAFYDDSPTHDVMRPLRITGCSNPCPLEEFQRRLRADL